MDPWDRPFSTLSTWDTSEPLSSLLLDELRYFGNHCRASIANATPCRPQLRQTSADFCVAVTDPKGRFVREGFENRVPKTADEFAEYWRNSELGRKNAEEAAKTIAGASDSSEHLEHFRQSAKAEKAKHLSKDSKFVISYP